MDNERYMELERKGLGLTKEEQELGWHWCDDWDLMLVGPGMPAQESCVCFKKPLIIGTTKRPASFYRKEN